VTGVNFPLLSIYERLRAPVRLAPNRMDVSLERALTNRYVHDLHYGSVYVDLDDTLIVREAVNVQLVAFLYQCLNEGRRLVLITRHRHDVDATLRRHRLAGLFDDVIRVEDAVEKIEHIEGGDAILIDDSFRERWTAHERAGIATFDTSMLELLIDDRA
jgi:hypothetical protein